MPAFTAIDFETADHGRDSACAVGLARVENGKIARTAYRLIRPPRRQILFTHIHNITWKQVAGEPDFAGVWPELAYLFEGIDFIAAHNAPFDRGVLYACCAAAGLQAPPQPFVCTVQLARKELLLKPSTLSHVCHHLSIPLKHHNALSDAEACAKIMITVEQERAEKAAGANSPGPGSSR
ncbi:MAG TPA: exonuclease [Elusimicrobia bacterium]|nr:MAG: exonuclease [Elusimicrobia bacterium GWA2_64_40]OGR64104.1 MAG: exonuclease [Elusimicrobia bacterium GWB2_63_16]HAN05786.1 exonuclease [Elusimicrobiota bacterium]HAU90345.1 exonuclease [Elusimicrobiota bacterium]